MKTWSSFFLQVKTNPQSWSGTKEHGRKEHRRLWVQYKDVWWLPWPSIQQVWKYETSVFENGKRRKDILYGMTSLVPNECSAKRLMQLIRGHWGIENTGHCILDVTMNEDKSRCRKSNVPINMAVLRRLALNILQLGNKRVIPDAMAEYASSLDFIVQHALMPVSERRRK